MSAVYTSSGIAQKMGVSYRQLDYWVTQGFIEPTQIDGGSRRVNEGPGKHRIWAGDDVEAAVIFAHLVAAGFAPGRIGTMHRQLAEGRTVYLPHSLRLVRWEPES